VVDPLYWNNETNAPEMGGENSAYGIDEKILQ
jgi:hypothetical protein